MTKNVLNWLEVTSKKYESHIAYKDMNSSINFKEVMFYSKAIGTALSVVNATQPIAVISNRNINTVVAYLGVAYSGHAYAPIDSNLPEQRIHTIMELLKPSAILVDKANESLAKKLANGLPFFIIEDAINTQADDDVLLSIQRKTLTTDPLYVIFTSGSTGKPKGVITSHHSLMCYIESYSEVMYIRSDDVLGNQSPLDYIAAIRDIYLPLYTGCSTVIIPKEYFMQPTQLFDYMNDNLVTSVGWSVSALTIVSKLNGFKDNKLNTLKKICFSGSIMPTACLREWQKNLPDAKFVNQYGPTEATASCTYYEINRIFSDDEQIPIGIPYNNYKVFIIKDDLSYAKVGEIGEICVSGPALALGYYNDTERTNNSFILNPNNNAFPEKMYRTGDYGRQLENGILEFHGRMDRQIKHMGHRVELDEIESAAYRLGSIQECIAIYDKEKEVISLFYVGNIESKELFVFLKNTIPVFMVPRKIRRVDVLPRLANGKIDMNTLSRCNK